MAAAYAGLRLGVTKFDASIAGLGGCPFAATDGAAGNICTEDFAFMCEEMGVETGLDIDRLIEVAKIAEEVVGRPLPGHVMRGGTLKAAKPRPRRRPRHERRDHAAGLVPDSTYVDVADGAVEADAFSRHRGQDADGEQGDRHVDPADALGARARACRSTSMSRSSRPTCSRARFSDHDGVCRAGNYVWRRAGSRHDAWTDEGCLVLAFFLKPNTFFD